MECAHLFFTDLDLDLIIGHPTPIIIDIISPIIEEVVIPKLSIRNIPIIIPAIIDGINPPSIDASTIAIFLKSRITLGATVMLYSISKHPKAPVITPNINFNKKDECLLIPLSLKS